MPDSADQTASNKSALNYTQQRWNVTTEQARQRLDAFRSNQGEATRLAQNRLIQSSTPPPPPSRQVVSETRTLQANPNTLSNQGGSALVTPTVNGFDGEITMCVSDGMGGFSEKTGLYVAGLLISVT